MKHGKFYIPENEISFTFARSSGPGGQNVNKLNTKAQLTWDISQNETIAGKIKERFLVRFKNLLNSENKVQITSDQYRSQDRNKDNCLSKLNHYLMQVEHPPQPRKKTKPTRASIEARLASKKHHSEKKKNRNFKKY